MAHRKPRRSYNRAISSARERYTDEGERSDFIPISDTIQNISKTSPRDLVHMKSPVKTPKVPLHEKVLVSPRMSPLGPAPRISTKSSVTSPRVTSPRMSSPKIQSPHIASPRIRSPEMKSPFISSPRIVSPRLSSPRIASPRAHIPEANNSIDITPNVSLFMQTPSKSVRPIYEKRTTITNLDSEETPKKLHTVVRETTKERTRNVRIDNKDDIEKEVERIIKNGDYKNVSSKLPRLDTPKRTDLIPSYGDTFTRNGVTYVYDDGWRAMDSSDITEDRPPIVSSKDKIFKDIPNYNILTPEQQIYLRSKFNIKFDMMRETWPQYKIPIMGADMPLEHIHIMYNHYVKHIYARENAQNYELYVIVFWLAMQAIAVKLLGLPAQGFYKFRANRMGKYRMLLIQLGEKYHGEFGEGWPVEIKILLMSVLEIVVFIILRLLISLGDEANDNAVTFICDMIDRHFGITGVRSNANDTEEIPIKEPETNDDVTNIPNISIPSLPEEANNISKITNWIPTITSKLGIDDTSKPAKNNKSANSVTDKIRARASARPQQYSPPPFNC